MSWCLANWKRSEFLNYNGQQSNEKQSRYDAIATHTCVNVEVDVVEIEVSEFRGFRDTLRDST